ncbi:YidB family protein [Zoogloea sp. LCSB751]|uniref:YidB family protein n=1 Tax=Zoogloea sp. LCSB751 TaxID=1965277 RepID=UPI0009A47473|nr:YidB family protein [Zoogloea sp. LCSB751]
MGLFDQVVGAVMSGQATEGAGNPLLAGIMQLVNDPQTGGLAGLVQAFQNGGLGDIAKSWVSTGQNLPISAEQIQSVLGSSGILQSLASQFGLDSEQVSGQLAELLPQVVDKLTPNGAIPESNDLVAQGIELLKGKLFG